MDTQLTADQRDFAETVRNSGDALLTIINDILDFSKIEAGKLDLEQQPFDLRECVESALDLMKIKASEKGLELACEIAPDVLLPSWAMSPACARSWSTCSTMRSSSPRQARSSLRWRANRTRRHGDTGTRRRRSPGHRVSPSPYLCISPWRDTGIGIPPDGWGGCSRRSARWTPRLRASTGAPAWGWPSASG